MSNWIWVGICLVVFCVGFYAGWSSFIDHAKCGTLHWHKSEENGYYVGINVDRDRISIIPNRYYVVLKTERMPESEVPPDPPYQKLLKELNDIYDRMNACMTTSSEYRKLQEQADRLEKELDAYNYSE